MKEKPIKIGEGIKTFREEAERLWLLLDDIHLFFEQFYESNDELKFKNSPTHKFLYKKLFERYEIFVKPNDFNKHLRTLKEREEDNDREMEMIKSIMTKRTT